MARAYAYGGAVIQDLGYYPFGSHFFSNLVHYVRTGDFVETMLRDAQDVNEYAFALGALAHYTADNVGHPEAVNRAVALMFPKLRAKYGDIGHLRRRAGQPRDRRVLVRRRAGGERRLRLGHVSELHRLSGGEAGARARLPRRSTASRWTTCSCPRIWRSARTAMRSARRSPRSRASRGATSARRSRS